MPHPPVFFVPPHPSPGVVLGHPAPQPRGTEPTGRRTGANPRPTGTDPEQTISLGKLRAKRDTRDQDILQWKKGTVFFYKVNKLARDSANG